jgi:hypothetical protein
LTRLIDRENFIIQNSNVTGICTSIKEIKKVYQPRTNLVKDEKGDQLADSHDILNRWRNHFCQLLNVRGVNDFRQMEMHIAEPIVPEPSFLEVATGKLKGYKS